MLVLVCVCSESVVERFHLPDKDTLQPFPAAILYTGGLDVIRKEAWPFYRTSSGVRLCWELEEPKGAHCMHVHLWVSATFLLAPRASRRDRARRRALGEDRDRHLEVYATIAESWVATCHPPSKTTHTAHIWNKEDLNVSSAFAHQRSSVRWLVVAAGWS